MTPTPPRPGFLPRPGTPDHRIRAAFPAARPVHIPVEQRTTVLFITAVDSVDNLDPRRSVRMTGAWTDR
ncbi:hypothetical protein [Brachybacterium sacelli]|uniref:hypothetical protein n=1 Tax=Brachybacterium sacelli TaxID=173364 RepID=UPI0036188227